MMWSSVLAFGVLPEALLSTNWFITLEGFVAINTILYVTLSIFKIMPKLYLSDYIVRRGRRSETRSIYPDGEGPPDDWEPPLGSLAAMAAGLDAHTDLGTAEAG